MVVPSIRFPFNTRLSFFRERPQYTNEPAPENLTIHTVINSINPVQLDQDRQPPKKTKT